MLKYYIFCATVKWFPWVNIIITLTVSQLSLFLINHQRIIWFAFQTRKKWILFKSLHLTYLCFSISVFQLFCRFLLLFTVHLLISFYKKTLIIKYMCVLYFESSEQHTTHTHTHVLASFFNPFLTEWSSTTTYLCVNYPKLLNTE